MKTTTVSTPAKNTGSTLHLEVYTSTPNTFQATSTLIFGARDAVLIDAQFTLSQAAQVVDMIKWTGKRLTNVYITHGHPDHYWGLVAIKEAFPAAKLQALPETIEDMRKTQQERHDTWKPSYGADIPDNPVFPEPLEGRTIELEGNQLQIMTSQGDAAEDTFVWIPSLKAVIAGDIVYNNINIWVLETDKASRALWIKSIDKIMGLKPEIVVAGHKDPNASDTPDCLAFTTDYLIAFDKAVESSKSATEVVTKIKTQFPKLNGMEEVLQMAAKAVFPAG